MRPILALVAILLGGTLLAAEVDSRLLIVAAIEGDIPAARKLLGDGADPTVTDPKTGNGLLVFAVANGRNDMLRFLLDRGLDVNHRNDTGVTPLMFAVLKRNHAAVRLLVDYGADLEARNNAPGFTAYMLADSRDDATTMKLLEELGASVCGGCRRHGDL